MNEISILQTRSFGELGKMGDTVLIYRSEVPISPYTNKPCNEGQISENQSIFFCEVCKKSMNGLRPTFQHLKGKNHKNAKKKRADVEKQVELDGKESSMIEDEVKKQPDGEALKCDDCNLKFDSIVTAISHFKGKKHIAVISAKGIAEKREIEEKGNVFKGNGTNQNRPQSGERRGQSSAQDSNHNGSFGRNHFTQKVVNNGTLGSGTCGRNRDTFFSSGTKDFVRERSPQRNMERQFRSSLPSSHRSRSRSRSPSRHSSSLSNFFRGQISPQRNFQQINNGSFAARPRSPPRNLQHSNYGKHSSSGSRYNNKGFGSKTFYNMSR